MTTIASEIERLQTAKADLKTVIENKGVTVDPAATLDSYDDYVDGISTGVIEVEEKDVNFYDYDGTRVYSYTKAEFAELEALPSNPSHEGLMAQGWNWSLTDAKTHVSKYDYLDIGQLYITSDNKTRLLIHVYEAPYTLYSGIQVNNVVVNWGDSQENQTVSSGYLGSHTYNSSGDFTITLDASNGSFSISGYDGYGSYIFTDSSYTNNTRTSYLRILKEINFGSNAYLSNYAFYKCSNLTKVSLPDYKILFNGFQIFGQTPNLGCLVLSNKNTGYSGTPTFIGYQSSLKRFIVPSNFIDLGAYFFRNNTALSSFSIPYGCVSIPNDAFETDYAGNIFRISIPETVTSIGNNAFRISGSLTSVNMLNFSSIPSLGSQAFYGCSPDLKIKIPDSLYESWVTTTNWSSYVSNIIPYKNGNPLTKVTLTLAVDQSIQSSTTLNKSQILTAETHTINLPTLSDITTTEVGGKFYFNDGTTNYELGDSITVTENKTFTLYHGEIYEPTAEENEQINYIIGLDLDDPTEPDMVEAEVDAILDNIIGDNE